MKLLKIRVDGALLFKDRRFELDFIASDRVPRDEEGNIADVAFVPGSLSVYTQNVMGFVGVNASGKTTALNLIRWVLGYLTGTYSMRSIIAITDCYGKLDKDVSISCVFVESDKCYLIESKLKHSSGHVDDSRFGEQEDTFAFDEETLWQLPVYKVSRKLAADVDLFKQRAELFMRRNGSDGDGKVLDEARRTFLGDDMSIVSMVTKRKTVSVESPERSLLPASLPTPVVQAFDASVEYLKWNSKNQVFHLKFKDESSERVLSSTMAKRVLSNGTVLGTELVERAIETLNNGGYLIIDEMETGLNRSLAGTVIGLFASPATNPKGATLLFTTHYPELLDMLRRKDNVYVLIRDDTCKTELVRYSDQIKRIENKKSEVIINNVIKGSMPKYPDVQAMRDYVCEHVHG